MAQHRKYQTLTAPRSQHETLYANLYVLKGNEVFYDIHVSSTTLSPDGNAKDMLVIDGKYPGTLIEAREFILLDRYIAFN